MKKIFLILLIIFANIEASALEKVTLQLKWKYQFQFAGFIMAKEKGFYKDAGLDVTLQEFDKSINIIESIDNGSVDFAVSDSALIVEVLKGENMLAMLSILQSSPYALMALKSSGIEEIEDINSKRVSMYDNFNAISLEILLKSNDINYIKTPVEYSLDHLKSGKNDLAAVYLSNEPFVAQEMGLDVVLFNPKDYGFDGYGDILFSSQKMLKKRPQLVKKMYEASKKGWEYAFSHIQESADLIFNKYNTLHKSKKALIYEGDTLKSLSGYGKNFGQLQEEKVKSIAQFFTFMSKGKYNLKNLDGFIYKPENKKTIRLSQEEKEYLKNKEKIKVCVDPDWMPFEKIDKDGKYVGIISEYIKLFSDRLDIDFALEKTKTYQQSREYLKLGKCDIIAADVATDVVKKSFLTTKPYLLTPRAFAIHSDTKGVQNFSQIALSGEISILASSPLESILKEKYPTIKTDSFATTSECLNSVETKKTIAFVGPISAITYYIQTNGLLNIDIGGIFNSEIKLSVLVNKNQAQLIPILNKTIDTISEQERLKILNIWSKVTYKHKPNYLLVFQVVAIATLIILMLLFLYLKLRKLKKQLEDINLTLEEKVKGEVEKNKKQQLLMLHQSRLAQMGEMISMIAHQWRQPLNTLAILNQTIVLKYIRGKLDDEIVDSFKVNSKKQIEQMSNTIDDFRDFFKPEKERVEFDINDAIEHTIEILKPVFKENNIYLEFEKQAHCNIVGYQNELGQAILNILSNAKDALIEKEIKEKKIHISLSKTDNKIILLISDNAGGIPDNIIDKVFDPYFSTKEEKNGTGLGLYMTKMIVEEHIGAKLSVTNSTNGAVFKICFS